MLRRIEHPGRRLVWTIVLIVVFVLGLCTTVLLVDVAHSALPNSSRQAFAAA